MVVVAIVLDVVECIVEVVIVIVVILFVSSHIIGLNFIVVVLIVANS